MAALVFTNGYVLINAVDLSDHTKQVKLTYKAELQDATAMGNTTRTRLAGLLDWSAVVDFINDYASGKTDATLFPLVGAAAFAVKFQAVNNSGTGTATNPVYSGNAVLGQDEPVSGQIGALLMRSVTFEAAGALSRVTS